MSLEDDAESQEVERIDEPEISDQVDDAEISPAVSEAKPILDEVVAMAGLKVARNQLDEKEPEELSLEELEDGVLLQKVLVKQLRADYAVRLERSEVMDRELKELGSDPGILQMKVAEAKRQSEELLALANREAMRAEDGLGRVWRLYQSRSQSQLLAQQLAKRSRSDLEALRRSRGHVEKEVAAEVLSDQRRRIEMLKAEAAAQDEKLLSLGADLRSTLDFMVRVNLDARGARRPKELGQLPELQALNLSEVGQGHMAEILKKYEVYLENSRANPEALHRAALRHGLSVPAAQHAAQQMQRQKPLPLPSHEEATESFAEERRLLRARLMEEMQKVAQVLAEESKSEGHEELLRAAAWGEERTLRELLGLQLAMRQDLCGWTAWHSAAAHGQEKVIALLCELLPDSIDASADCGLTALGMACLRGHVGTARCLVQSGCSLFSRDVRGNSCLHWAAASSSAGKLAELLLNASADPFACNGSGQLPDIPNLQELALQRAARAAPAPATATTKAERATAGGAALAFGARPPLSSGMAPSAPSPRAAPKFAYIRVEAKPSGGLLSSLVSLKPPLRDRANVCRHHDAKRVLHLSPAEENVGIWSDWVTNFTHAGLEHAVAADAPPSSDPTNSSCNTQALVLTSERLLFLRCVRSARSPNATWSVAMGVALAQLRQVILPRRSDSLLLLRVHHSSDELLNFQSSSRDAFLEELWQCMVRAGWPGRLLGEDEDNEVAPKDFVVLDPEPVMPLLDLGSEREAAKGTLAFLGQDFFALLPRAPSSLLLSGAETVCFGFLELQLRRQPKEAGAGVCWQWQKFFFIAKGGRHHERCLGWCLHPNCEKWTGHILVQKITQVRSVRGKSGEACLVLQSEGQLGPTALKARHSRERDEWKDALRRLGVRCS